MTTDFETTDEPTTALEYLLVGGSGVILLMFLIEFILATPGATLLRMSFEFFSGYFAWTIWENRQSLKQRRCHV